MARAFWTEDEDPSWYEVTDTQPGGSGDWEERSKAERPLPPGREQVADGAVQRFEGGMMLFLPRPEGPRTILVLAAEIRGIGRDASWREFPD